MKRLVTHLLALVAFSIPAFGQDPGGGYYRGALTSLQVTTALGFTPAGLGTNTFTAIQKYTGFNSGDAFLQVGPNGAGGLQFIVNGSELILSQADGSQTAGSLFVPGTLRVTAALNMMGPYLNRSGTMNYLGTATGTADAMVATPSPALSALTKGAVYYVQAVGTNTLTNPTINPSALGAKTIVKRASTALAAGDYVTNMMMELLYDGTNFQFLNPIVN